MKIKSSLITVTTAVMVSVVALPASTMGFANTGALSQTEQQDLLFMREEEKLARDVYLSLYDQWGLPVFQNIAGAEQRHTDRIKALLNTYQLTDPVSNDSRGVFENPELQTLYNQLIAKGMQSAVDALEVGALIEETDIKDLQDAIARSNVGQLDQVYANLMRGSRNHLRAFAGNLNQRGISYTSTVLPQSEFDAIANSDRERGGHGGQGKGHGRGQGNGRHWQ